jgi:hypothetical protein
LAAPEQAFKQRSYVLAEYFNADERPASLQFDRRVEDLRRRMGLPKLQN